MLLVWLLAALQGPVVDPPHDLTSYLAIAARFRSADHSAAMDEIRSWTLPEIEAAAAGLRRQGSRLRAVPEAPGDIDFRTVEAAVLLHAEAGLLSLQSISPAEADAHLRVSAGLLDWSHTAADKQRQRGRAIAERINRRDFDMALAAASLWLGFPGTACSFAEEARRLAPLDAEVHLVLGCAAETRARELALGHQDSEAGRRRDQAERALSDALAIDPGLQEARLRLGQLLVDRGRLVQAESLLDQVEAQRGRQSPALPGAALPRPSRRRPRPRRRRGRLLPPRPRGVARQPGRATGSGPGSRAVLRALRRLATRRRQSRRVRPSRPDAGPVVGLSPRPAGPGPREPFATLE